MKNEFKNEKSKIEKWKKKLTRGSQRPGGDLIGTSVENWFLQPL